MSFSWSIFEILVLGLMLSSHVAYRFLRNSPSSVILVHILAAFNGREQEITDEASSIFPGEIILPNDFDIIEL